MQTYFERGVSRGDCCHKINSKYGPRYVVLRERTYKPSGLLGLFSSEKVEVEFYIPPLRGLGMPGISNEAYAPLPAEQLVFPQPSARKTQNELTARDDSTIDFNEEKKRLLRAAGKDPDVIFQQLQQEQEGGINQQLILDKLNTIQKQIDTGSGKNEHPHLVRIAQMLRQNDFSERYTAVIMERARKELSWETLEDFNALQDRIVEWIGESIKIYPLTDETKSGRLLVLVGPTGVGKTTTIVKLAATHVIDSSKDHTPSIRMITIDAYKVGAKDQIENFGNIMDIPVSYIDNRRDLRREIDLYREDTDLILVDTIGSSPRDSIKLGEINELLDACGSRAEIHLAMAASTKTSDMEHILQQFEPFNYQAVLLTKLDETRHIGNIISALAERGKSVSYITDGQSVHKDIKRASVVRFLTNLDEFRVDREELEKRFPAVGAGETALADQFQWS